MHFGKIRLDISSPISPLDRHLGSNERSRCRGVTTVREMSSCDNIQTIADSVGGGVERLDDRAGIAGEWLVCKGSISIKQTIYDCGEMPTVIGSPNTFETVSNAFVKDHNTKNTLLACWGFFSMLTFSRHDRRFIEAFKAVR